jgi:hypothetical protein
MAPNVPSYFYMLPSKETRFARVLLFMLKTLIPLLITSSHQHWHDRPSWRSTCCLRTGLCTGADRLTDLSQYLLRQIRYRTVTIQFTQNWSLRIQINSTSCSWFFITIPCQNGIPAVFYLMVSMLITTSYTGDARTPWAKRQPGFL